MKGWFTVFICAMTGCGLAAGFPQFSMTISALSEKSGLSPGILMTSDTVKSAAIVLSMLVSGFFFNKFGAKKVFLLSMLAAVSTQFFMPYVSSIAALMALKIVQGLAAMVFPVFLVIILRSVEERNAGISTAVFNGIFYAGGGLGATVAGFAIASYGWLSSYYIIGAVQLAAGLIWLLTVKAPPAEKPARKLKGGSDLMASPVMWLLAVSFFSCTWGIQAMTVDWVIFGEWLGYSESALGRIMSAATAGIILSCLISGKVSDFFSKQAKKKSLPRICVFIAGHGMVIASVCFLILFDMREFGLYYAATFLFAFSVSWGLGAFYSILPEIYPAETVPVSAGVAGGIGDIGMPVAPMVVGVLFGLNGFWNMGWVVCAAIAFCSFGAGLLLLIFIRKKEAIS